VKKGDVLKVLERHKMLTLALERKITQREAALFPIPKDWQGGLKRQKVISIVSSTNALIPHQTGYQRISGIR